MLERLRADRIIGHSLDAKVEIYAEPSIYELLKSYEGELSAIFIVSEALETSRLNLGPGKYSRMPRRRLGLQGLAWPPLPKG